MFFFESILSLNIIKDKSVFSALPAYLKLPNHAFCVNNSLRNTLSVFDAMLPDLDKHTNAPVQ